MGKRDRNRRAARRTDLIEPKRRILVVCEGVVTEPGYIDGFRKDCRNNRVDVKVVGGAGVPRTVVECAKEEKRKADKQADGEQDDNLRYEEVWVAFDVDEHPNLNDAKQMARDNDFRLAVSNPCIELWLLLHFTDSPGMQHRDVIRDRLKEHVPGYNKHVKYSEYAPRYENAKNRAERLETAAANDHDEGRNPTTGFWRLTESIRENA
jgi:hypothetical protein